ncbi:Hypothetical predicted protein, partial [Pelobates cultripes]
VHIPSVVQSVRAVASTSGLSKLSALQGVLPGTGASDSVMTSYAQRRFDRADSSEYITVQPSCSFEAAMMSVVCNDLFIIGSY